jgi:hypothetical protein
VILPRRRGASLMPPTLPSLPSCLLCPHDRYKSLECNHGDVFVVVQRYQPAKREKVQLDLLCVLYLFWNLLVVVPAVFSAGIIKKGEYNRHRNKG